MTRTARKLLTILSASLICLTLAADEREVKRELIEEYLVVTNAEEMLEDKMRLSFEQAESMVKESMVGAGVDFDALDPEERIELQKMVDQQTETMRRTGERLLLRMDLHEIAREVYAPIIDRYYSTDDLRELIAFYKTPIGQKQIEVQAQVAVDSEFEFYRILTPMITEVAEEIEKEDQEEDSRRNPWKPTMADMRAMATATEAYATDYDEYPAALTLDDLAGQISPVYIRTVPRKDAWGTEYLYIVSPDQMHYRFVSAGADRSFEGSSYTIAPDTQPPDGPRESLDSDIVYQDGMFFAYPAVSMRDR